jgi:para-nitrobenzyl esterase
VDALAKLRALSVAEIIDGGQESAGPGGPVTYSGPILDGRLAVETAQSAYEAGRQVRVPLLIGANSADFVGFISADTKEALFSQFGERKAEATLAYDPSGTTELRTLLVMAGTDRVQTEPARFTASVFVASGAPAYVYRFSYVPASLRERWQNGAPHGAEVPYAFATLGASQGPFPMPPRRPRTRRSPGRSTPTGPTSRRPATRMVRACRNGRVTIPRRMRSSSSVQMVRRSLPPIPGKHGWT